MMARKAACSAAAVIPEVGDPGQLPQQEHPQPIAGDGLPGAHGQAVDGPCVRRTIDKPKPAPLRLLSLMLRL